MTMCGGGKKSSSPAPVVAKATPIDPSIAARSQAAQEEAQRRANSATIVSATANQQPAGTFGSELGA